MLWMTMHDRDVVWLWQVTVQDAYRAGNGTPPDSHRCR
jgi:hypothetical protein